MPHSPSLVHLLWGQDKEFWGTLVPSSRNRSQQEAKCWILHRREEGRLADLAPQMWEWKCGIWWQVEHALVFLLWVFEVLWSIFRTQICFIPQCSLTTNCIKLSKFILKNCELLKKDKYFASFWRELFFKESSPHWGVYLTRSSCCLKQLW